MKHKPIDGILMNGGGNGNSQSMYDHKRKIDVSFLKKLLKIEAVFDRFSFPDTGELFRACFKCQKAKLEAF